MKETRLKTLGFALLGGLAFLFAGCGQQAGTGGTDGGQELPKPIQVSLSGVTPNELVSGQIPISVSINEDAQAQEVALYLDNTLVAKYNISSQGLRPQALSYNFTINTAACDASFLTSTSTGCTATKNTPLFTNGPRTIKAVVKNAVETKSLSVPVVLDNRDKIAFTLEGNSAADANGDLWYGNGDVKVKGVIVNYTGASYSFTKVNATTWKISRSGGTASEDSKFLPSGNQAIVGATLSSASGLELVFAKADNNTVQASSVSYLSLPLNSYLLSPAPTLRLDNVAPSGFSLARQRTYEETASLASPGDEVNKSTKLFRSGGTDGGVGIDPASFQVVLGYGVPEQTVTKTSGQDLSDIPTAVSSITVKKLVLKDRLGNTAEITTGLPTLVFDNQAPSLTVSGFTVVVAGNPYSINYTATGQAQVDLYLLAGGKYYLLAPAIPSPHNWTAFKLGDGPSVQMTLAVVARDDAGNFTIRTLTPTVAGANAADLEAPVVNSLQASGALQKGSGASTATLTAKASEKPSHTPGAVTFMHFFREHSNLPGFFLQVNVASTTSGNAEDSATSAPIFGTNYPNAGTFGTAVLVHDGSSNAALGTGTLQVQ